MATCKTFILTHAHTTSISMLTRFELNFFSVSPAHWLKWFTYLHIHIRLNALFILNDLWLHFNLINFVNINFFSPSSMAAVPHFNFIHFSGVEPFLDARSNFQWSCLCSISILFRNGKAPKCLKMKWKHILYHFYHFLSYFLARIRLVYSIYSDYFLAGP